MRSERDPGVCGLQRKPLSSVQFLFLPVKSEKNNRRPDSEESFIASVRAAPAGCGCGCGSLGEVLEPHFPPVLGRTHGAGSPSKKPRPSDSPGRSTAPWVRDSYGQSHSFLSGWAGPCLLSSFCSCPRAVLLALKGWLWVPLWDTGGW